MIFLIFLEIFEIFLDKFFFFKTPVFATFMSSDWKIGKYLFISFKSPFSISELIFFDASLYLLFLCLFTRVCFLILLTLLDADFVFGIVRTYICLKYLGQYLIIFDSFCRKKWIYCLYIFFLSYFGMFFSYNLCSLYRKP